MRLTRKEARKRESLEFFDIESDDEFLTADDGLDNDIAENLQESDEVNVALASVSSNDLNLGVNIETVLSSEDELNKDEDADDNVIENFSF